MGTRAHVVLPEEVIADVDQVAGKRKRSLFIETAIREKLARERQSAALRASAGILNSADYPEWDTPEKVSAWVRASRQQDDARTKQKLSRLSD